MILNNMKITKLLYLLSLCVFSNSVFAQDTISIEDNIKKWTLQDCLLYAKSHNISLKQFELDIKSTEEDKIAAMGSFLPRADAKASHLWTTGLNQNLTTGLLENQTNQYSSIGANINLNIFNGFQDYHRFYKSNLAIISQKYSLEDESNNTALYIVNAFSQIMFQKENVYILSLSKQNTEKELEKTKTQYNAGAKTETDLLGIKVQIAEAKQKLKEAKNQLKMSTLTLTNLLNIDLKGFDIDAQQNIVAMDSLLNQDSPNNIANKTFKEIFDKSKNNYLPIKIQETQLEIAEKDLEISKGAHYPTISAYYDFNSRASYQDIVASKELDLENPYSISNVKNLKTNEELQLGYPNYKNILGSYNPILDQFSNNMGNTFGVQISIPIFSKLQTQTSINKAKIRYERQRLQVENTKYKLKENIYKAYMDFKNSLEKYRYTKEVLNAKENLFQNYQKKYSLGMVTVIDYITTKNTFEKAKSDLLSSRYEAFFKLKTLEYYYGKLFF